MNKHLLIGATLAAAALAAGATVKLFTTPTPPAAAQSPAPALTFYATMNQSLDWTSTGAADMRYAIYSLTPGSDDHFARLSAIESAKVADAGVYFDGHYYTVKVPSSSSYSNYTSTFTAYDVDTWQPEVKGSYTTGTGNIAEDMTVDYTTGTVYAVGMNTLNGNERQLKTVNLSNGQMTRVGAMGANIYAIAADGNGQLWGVGNPSGNPLTTNLYKIDKNSGSTTFVAKMSINLYTGSLSSLTFDLRDGKLYYVAQTYTQNSSNERTWTNGLFEIDTANGRATLVQEFKHMEILAGLAMKDCHPKAPQAPSGLSFEFDNGSTTDGAIAFDLPTRTYDGTALGGTLRVEVTVDGNKVHEASGLTPGAHLTTGHLSLSAGSTHNLKATCYADTRKSVPAQAAVYAGTDTPAAPTGLTVTPNADGNAIHISWNASQSLHGGYIDASQLRYDVTLMPESKVLASDLAATKCDYTFTDRNMGVGQIRVSAKIGNATSPDAISPLFIAGTPWPVPYLETFDYSGEAMWPFTVIDANNDTDPDFGFRWYFGPNQRAAWYYTTPNATSGGADDWLITPAIAFDNGKVYRMQFDTYGYMGGVNSLEVAIGSHPTVDKMTRVIAKREYETPGYSATQPLSVACLFVPTATDARIGFHCVSDNSDHTFLDNIYISVYGPTTIPGEVTGLTASSTDRGVKLSFTTPAADAAGNKLGSLTDVKIYRTSSEGELLHTIASPATGKSYDFTDEAQGAGIRNYVVVASNADGPGLEASVSISTFADIPRAVESFTVSPRNGWSEAFLEWTYPASMTGANGGKLTDDDLSYDIYRTLDGTTTMLAQNVSGNSYFDNTCSASMPDGRRQVYVSYRIVPRTNGGEGQSTTSERIIMGLSYQLPFNESWAMQSQQNRTWTQSNCTQGSSWIINSDTAYDPWAKCHDGDYGQVSYEGSRNGYSSGDYISPRIDVSSFVNPKVTFHLYRSTDANTQGSSLSVGFVSEDYDTEILAERYNVYHSANGWEEYTVDIPEKFAESDRLSVVFRAFASSHKGQVHLDNVSVTGENPDKEIKAQRIVGGETCLIGNRNTYDVEVANIGTSGVSDITVEFYADDRLVATEQIASLAAGKTALAPFAITPGLDNSERTMVLRGVVKCATDANPKNNTIEATVNLTAPMLPFVTDITGYSPDNSSARIDWREAVEYPHVETVTDDVESYEPFAIDNIGKWTTVDRDEQITARISLGNGALEWNHAGEPQAFIVFNPTKAGAAAVIKPRSGSQCFISFASRTENDDWLISPQLSGAAQTLSFYAKCAYTTDLNERFEVWASQGSPDIADFKCISGESPVAVTSYNDWNRFSFSLPEGTKFFAIRCVSKQQTGLMIDDITYSPVHRPLELWGFNVYRDGVKITPSEIGEYSFTDTGLEHLRTYKYAVSAVYDAGESIFSQPVEVTVGVTAGIGSVDTDSNAVDIHAVTDGISITAPEGAPVTVGTPDGRTLYSFLSAGRQTVSLVPGIYIVRAAHKAAKIFVR